MKKNVITLVITVLLLSGLWYVVSDKKPVNTSAKDGHHDGEVVKNFEIYPKDVVDKINSNEDIVLLDVRTPEEHEAVHLKDSLLLPVQVLSGNTLANIGLGEDAKDKEIIIYCRSGNRSKTAYYIMKSLGYTNIKSVSGGMIHWEEDGYPHTETGAYAGPDHNTTFVPDAVSSDGPRIAIDNPFHDFGVIPQFGGVVQREFVVKNTGTETLVIGDVTTSCSCTSAQISQSEIPVDGQATLTVVFDPDFHEEPTDVFKRTVFVPTNDPTTPEAEVVVQIDIAEGE